MLFQQMEILNKICSILTNAPKKIDRLKFVYRFNHEKNWYGTALVTIVNGKVEAMNYLDTNEICKLCEQLHDVMQKHTGGDWQKFTLTIDEEGEAHTEFSYEPQSCSDGFEFEFAKDFK